MANDLAGMTPHFEFEPSDRIAGTDDRDIIIGGSGDEFIVAGRRNDIVRAGDGDDLIIGGRYFVGEIAPGEEVQETSPSDIVWLERPDPASFAETLSGGNGNDVIVGGSWIDVDGNDQVSLDELVLGRLSMQEHYGFNNIIWAGAGDDVAYGANGFDTIGGGAGNDELYGFDGVDIIYGGGDNDLIYGGDGDPELFHRFEPGSSEVLWEQLYGGDGDDTIYGEGGLDHIYGGNGNDLIYGGDGDGASFENIIPEGDGLTTLTLVETLYGGNGSDTIYGEGGIDHIYGGSGLDWMWGGEGADVMFGEGGNDRLRGGDDNDQLYGGDGNDWLYGQGGDDTLTGGEGIDYFIFPGDGSTDFVTDFNVEEDWVFFHDIEQQFLVDAYMDEAEDATMNGVEGLLISNGAGSLFLAGVSENDLANVQAEANVVIQLGA